MASSISLRDIYRELLVPLLATGDDLLDLLHVRLQIERGLEESPTAKCEVYQMRPKTKAASYRGLEKGAIKNLLQGANARTGYPGDRALRSESNVTLQIHTLELRNESGNVVVRDVPVVAVSLPEKMRADVYQETEGD